MAATTTLLPQGPFLAPTMSAAPSLNVHVCVFLYLPRNHSTPQPLPSASVNHFSSYPLRTAATHWDLKARGDSVSQYAHYPFPPPVSSRLLSAGTIGALARSYYTSQEERRHLYHDGLIIHLCHGHRPPMLPTPGLFCSGSCDRINTVKLDSPLNTSRSSL